MKQYSYSYNLACYNHSLYRYLSVPGFYEASGIYPSYVRPPFGAWIKDMELSVTMLPVFWDVDTLDWKSKNIDSILSIAQKQVHDGSIILMHDSYQTSVDAALKIADLFTEKGYVFVTADQLLLT